MSYCVSPEILTPQGFMTIALGVPLIAGLVLVVVLLAADQFSFISKPCGRRRSRRRP